MLLKIGDLLNDDLDSFIKADDSNFSFLPSVFPIIGIVWIEMLLQFVLKLFPFGKFFEVTFKICIFFGFCNKFDLTENADDPVSDSIVSISAEEFIFFWNWFSKLFETVLKSTMFLLSFLL